MKDMSTPLETIAPSMMRPADLDLLERVLEDRPCLKGREGFEMPIPDPIFHILLDTVQQMKKGRTVVLIPKDETCTTQAAASLLGVSRPFLIRLLEGGKIPFHHAGTHRKVKLNDLRTYMVERDKARRKTLDGLFDEMDEAGFCDQTE